MSDIVYTYSEVADALENVTWKRSYIPSKFVNGRYVEGTEADRVFYDEEFEWSQADEYDVIPTEIGDIKIIEADTGGEGHGEDISVVIYVEDTGQFFKKEGCYRSYDGSEWDGDLREVSPVERMVMFYE